MVTKNFVTVDTIFCVKFFLWENEATLGYMYVLILKANHFCKRDSVGYSFKSQQMKQ